MNSFTHDSQTLLEQRRQRLEATLRQTTEQIVHRPSRLRQVFNHIGHALVHWLTQGDTPRIQRFTQGETEVWKVYDPIDHRTHYFTQEDDVRSWLDQRYYS